MKHYTKKNIIELEKVKRLNIINSITGIKPGNLIGSMDNDKTTNLAIFSSVVHLGSQPALLGFILRPQVNVVRDTYNNIMSNKLYTDSKYERYKKYKKKYSKGSNFDLDLKEINIIIG